MISFVVISFVIIALGWEDGNIFSGN